MANLDITAAMPIEVKLGVLGKWLDSLAARDGLNGTVLIGKGGRRLFAWQAGVADCSGTTPLAENSSFALAGVSKQFTAMAVMMLARAGKLTLDDPITRHLPELAPYGGATIRHLLHHTAGLPDYLEIVDKFWTSRATLTTAAVTALLAQYRPPAYFPPGTQFEYSNTGYALLAEIVARAAAMPFAQFLAQEIFGPLGMQDSAVLDVAAPSPLRARVFGMRREQGRKVESDLNYLDGVAGDTGVFASAADLLRWDTALRNGTLLPTELYAEAYRSGELPGGKKTGYGFGWEIEPPDVVWHWGQLQGFTAYIRRDLKQETLLVMLSNLGPARQLEPVSDELGEFMYEL